MVKRGILVTCLVLCVCLVSALAWDTYPNHECIPGYYYPPLLAGLCTYLRNPVEYCDNTDCQGTAYEQWFPGYCDPLEDETCYYDAMYPTYNYEVEEYCVMYSTAEWCDCRWRRSGWYRTLPVETCIP